MFLLKKLRRISNEERWNVYTHLVSLILSFFGVIYLLFFKNNSLVDFNLGLTIYSFSLIFLFFCSTFYHYNSDHNKLIWRKLDHIAIYFLIAGTYTPIYLNFLSDSSSKLILILIWIIAFLGAIYKTFLINKFESFSLILYLLMGWMVIFDLGSIIEIFNFWELFFLFFGGLFYSTGVFFYKMDKLKYNHAIWHVFVFFGSLSHFIVIANFRYG